jgi:hypothetical protein
LSIECFVCKQEVIADFGSDHAQNLARSCTRKGTVSCTLLFCGKTSALMRLDMGSQTATRMNVGHCGNVFVQRSNVNHHSWGW